MSTQPTSTFPAKIGDKITLQITHSTRQVITFKATCYKVNNDGTCGLQIPDKVMALQFCPYPSKYMKFKNSFAACVINRA